MSLYRGYFATEGADPSGKCKVQLVCADLGLGYEHCGIEVEDTSPKRYYHVITRYAGVLGSDTCNVRDTGANRINTPIGVGNWRIEETWLDPSGVLCGCIDRIAELIQSKKLVYAPVPYNEVISGVGCRTQSYCNSNYTTHCIMKKCGIESSKDREKTAPGWNHRMKECPEDKMRRITPSPAASNFSCPVCICEDDGWVTIDNEWCDDSPAVPKVKPDSQFDQIIRSNSKPRIPVEITR